MSVDILQLAQKYNASSKGALCDKIILDVLNNECMPIHYKSEKLSMCHEIYINSKKSCGAYEEVRNRYSNYKNRIGAGIINGGFIYLKKWSETDGLKMYSPPKNPLTFDMTALDWEYGVGQFIRRRNFMHDKGIPDDIRINGLVSEEATKRILKIYNPDKVIDKDHHPVFNHNDHDFKIIVSEGKFIKVDAKSLQSSYGWSIGNSIKKNMLYIFTGPSKNGLIDLYGYQFGAKLLELQKDRIQVSDINDIRKLLGWLSFNYALKQAA